MNELFYFDEAAPLYAAAALLIVAAVAGLFIAVDAFRKWKDRQ